MREKRLWQLVLLVAAVLSFVPGSTSSERCNCLTTCPDDASSPYLINTRYRYSYESQFVTTLPGLSNEQSGLRLRSTVDITALSPCEFSLKLSSVRIDQLGGSAASSYSSYVRQLTASDLRFGVVNGRVESVCPSASESRWSLNIKRAVLSAFQSTENVEIAETKIETDVSGSNCRTNYTINSRSSNSISVTKSKDLTKCSQKHTTHSLPHLLQIFGEPISAIPLVRGTQECNQVYTLASGAQLAQTECTETHVFLTINSKQQGATIQVTNKLNFVDAAAVRAQESSCIGSSSSRTTLKMEVDSETTSNAQAVNVRPTLRAICQMRSQRTNTFDTILRLPVAFLELQAHMRMMRSEDFDSLWNNLGSLCDSQQHNAFIRKLLVDAIAMTQTDASVSFIQKLFNSQQLRPNEAHILLDSLFLVSKPTSEMIKNMRTLLQQAENAMAIGASAREGQALAMKAYLLSSTMMSRFCKEVGQRCVVDDGMAKVSNWFDRKLVEGRENPRQLTMVLKAIGNVGLHNFPKLEMTVRDVIESKSYPIAVRLAALDTVRNVPCSYKLRSIDLTDILRRSQPLPLEMRIRTYLLLTRCPSMAMFAYVKDVILSSGDDMENSQLRSFVWTHLRNLESSQRPDVRSAWRKTFAQYGFSLAKFETEFSRKESFTLSRNYEHTINLDGANLGATLQTNLIWNPAANNGRSQSNVTRSLPIDLPQAVGFNLTVNLFGVPVNLVEFESRFVNLESVFESLFNRALGQFMKNEARDTRETSEEELNAINSYSALQSIKRLDESKRETQLINSIEQRLAVDLLNPDANTNPDDMLGFDSSLRLLGYEVRYEQFLVRAVDTLLSDLLATLVPAAQQSSTAASTSSFSSTSSQSSSSNSNSSENFFSNMAEIRNRLFRLLKTVWQTREFQHEFTKTFNLLSITQRLPTVFGAPLKLALNATALLDIAMRGSFDADNLPQVTLQTSITPVATLQLATFAGLEFAPSQDFGVQMETNMRSTFELDTAVQFESGQLFKFTWNVPKDRLDLFAISSNVSFVSGEVRAAVNPQTDAENTVERVTCMPAAASSQLKAGFKLCFAYRLPKTIPMQMSPIYTLLISNVAVSAEKTDTHTAYTVDIDYRNDEESKRALFSFDMPGATRKVDRKLLIDANVNFRQKAAKFEIISPWKRAVFEALFNTDDATFMRARLAGSIDDFSLMNLTFENRWTKENTALTGQRRRVIDTFEPRFSLQYGTAQPVVANGLIKCTSTEDADGKAGSNRPTEVRADISIDNLFKRRLFVRGSASYEDNVAAPRYNVTVTFGSAWYNGRLYGSHVAQPAGACTQEFTVEFTRNGEQTPQEFSMRNSFKPGNSSFFFKSQWQANSWRRDLYAKYYSYPDGRSQHEFEMRDETAAEPRRFLLAGGWNVTRTNGKIVFSADEQLVAPARSWDYQLSIRHKQDKTTFDHRTTVRAGEKVTAVKVVYADINGPRGIAVSNGVSITLSGSPRRTVIADCEVSSPLVNARLYSRAVRTSENEIAVESAASVHEIGLNSELAWYAAQTTARNGGVELQFRFVDFANPVTPLPSKTLNSALSQLLGFEELIAVARYELSDRRSMIDVEFTRNRVKYGQLTLRVEPNLRDAQFEAALALLNRFEMTFGLNLSRSDEVLAIGHTITYRFGEDASSLHRLDAAFQRRIQTDEYSQRRIRTSARVAFDDAEQAVLNYTLERKSTSYVNDFTLAYRPEVVEDGLIVFEWLARKILFALGMESARQRSATVAADGDTQMKRINLHADYDFDDGWTQKGLSANLRIQTPFTNWQDVVVRFGATGRLTAIKIELDGSFGPKRFALNIELDPRSILTDNTIKMRLITPWATLSYLNTQFRYLLTATQVRFEVLQEMNANNRLRLNLGWDDRSTHINSESVAQRKREYGLTVDFESFLSSVSRSNWTVHTTFHHLDDMASAYETTLMTVVGGKKIVDLSLNSQVGGWLAGGLIPKSLNSEMRCTSEVARANTIGYSLKYQPVADATRDAQKFKFEHTLNMNIDNREETTTHTAEMEYRIASDYSLTVDSQLTSSFDSVGSNTLRFEVQVTEDSVNLLGKLTSPVLWNDQTLPAVKFAAQINRNEAPSKLADGSGSISWQVPFASQFSTMNMLFNYEHSNDGFNSRIDSRWTNGNDRERFVTLTLGWDRPAYAGSFTDAFAALDNFPDTRFKIETSFSQLPNVTFTHVYTARRKTTSKTIPQRDSLIVFQIADYVSMRTRQRLEAGRTGGYYLESNGTIHNGRNMLFGLDYIGTLTTSKVQADGKAQVGPAVYQFKVELNNSPKWMNATMEYSPVSTGRASRRSPQSSFRLSANCSMFSLLQFDMDSKSGTTRSIAKLNVAPGTFVQKFVYTDNEVPRFQLNHEFSLPGSFLHEYDNQVRPFWNYRQSKLFVAIGNDSIAAGSLNRSFQLVAELNRRTLLSTTLVATSSRGSALQHLALSATAACSLRDNCTQEASFALRNLQTPLDISVHAKYQRNDAAIQVNWDQSWRNASHFEFMLRSSSTLSSLLNLAWFDRVFNTQVGLKWIVPNARNFSVSLLGKFYNEFGFRGAVDWIGSPSDWVSKWGCDANPEKRRYAFGVIEVMNSRVPVTLGFSVGTPRSCDHLVASIDLRAAENYFKSELDFARSSARLDWSLDTASRWWRRYNARVFTIPQSSSDRSSRATMINFGEFFVMSANYSLYANQRSFAASMHLPQRWSNAAELKIEHRESPITPPAEGDERTYASIADRFDSRLHDFTAALLFPVAVPSLGTGLKLTGQLGLPMVQNFVANLEVLEPTRRSLFRRADATMQWGGNTLFDLRFGVDESARFGILIAPFSYRPTPIGSLNVKLDAINFDYTFVITRAKAAGQTGEQWRFMSNSARFAFLDNSLDIEIGDTPEMNLRVQLLANRSSISFSTVVSEANRVGSLVINATSVKYIWLTNAVGLTWDRSAHTYGLNWRSAYLEQRLRKTGNIVAASFEVGANSLPTISSTLSLTSIYEPLSGLSGSFNLMQRQPRGQSDTHTAIDITINAPLFDELKIELGHVPCQNSVSFSMQASEKVPYFAGTTSFEFSATTAMVMLQFRQPYILRQFGTSSDQNVIMAKLNIDPSCPNYNSRSGLLALPYDLQFTLDGCFMAPLSVSSKCASDASSARTAIAAEYDTENIFELTSVHTRNTFDLTARLPASRLVATEYVMELAYRDDPRFNNEPIRMQTVTVKMSPRSSSYGVALQRHNVLNSWAVRFSGKDISNEIKSSIVEFGWSAPQSFADMLYAAQLTFKAIVDDYVNINYRYDLEMQRSYSFRLVSESHVAIAMPSYDMQMRSTQSSLYLHDASRKHIRMESNSTSTNGVEDSWYNLLTFAQLLGNLQRLIEISYDPTDLRYFDQLKSLRDDSIRIVTELRINGTHFYLSAANLTAFASYVNSASEFRTEGSVSYAGALLANVKAQIGLVADANRQYRGMFLVNTEQYTYANVDYVLRYSNARVDRSREMDVSLDMNVHSNALLGRENKQPMKVQLRAQSTDITGTMSSSITLSILAPWPESSPEYQELILRTTFQSRTDSELATVELVVPGTGTANLRWSRSSAKLEVTGTAPYGAFDFQYRNEQTKTMKFELRDSETQQLYKFDWSLTPTYGTVVDIKVRQDTVFYFSLIPTIERKFLTRVNLTLVIGIDGWREHQLAYALMPTGDFMFVLSSDIFPTLVGTPGRTFSLNATNLQAQPAVLALVTPFSAFPGLTIRIGSAAKIGIAVNVNVTLAKDNSLYAVRFEFVDRQRIVFGLLTPQVAPIELIINIPQRVHALTINVSSGTKAFAFKLASNFDGESLDPLFEFHVKNKLWNKGEFDESPCPFRRALGVILSNSSVRLTKTRRPVDSNYMLDVSYRDGAVNTNSLHDGYAARIVLTGIPRSLEGQTNHSMSFELTLAAPRTVMERSFVSFWSFELNPALARIRSRHPTIDAFRAFELSVNGNFRPDTQRIDNVLRITYVPNEDGNRQEETFTATANFSMRYDGQANQRVVNASFTYGRSLSSDHFYMAVNADYLVVNSQRILGELEFIRNNERVKSSLELSLENFSKLNQLPNLDRNGIRKLVENRMVFLYSLRTPYDIVKDMTVSLQNDPAQSSVAIRTRFLNSDMNEAAVWEGAMRYFFSESPSRFDWLQIDMQVPSSSSKLLYRFEKLPHSLDRFSSKFVLTAESAKQFEFNVTMDSGIVQVHLASALRAFEKFRVVTLTARPYSGFTTQLMQIRENVQLRGYQFDFSAIPSVERVTFAAAVGDQMRDGVNKMYMHLGSTSQYESWRSVASNAIVSSDPAFTRVGMAVRVVHNARTLVNTNITIAKNIPSVISFDETRSQPLFVISASNGRFPYPSYFELKLFNYFDDRARATTYLEYGVKVSYGETRDAEPDFFKHTAFYYKSKVQTAYGATGVRNVLRLLLPNAMPFGKDRVVNYIDVSKDGQSGRLTVREKVELFVANVEASSSLDLRSFDVVRNVQQANVQRYALEVDYDNQSLSGDEKHAAGIRIVTPTDRIEARGDTRLTRFSQFGNLTIITQSGDAAERISQLIAKLDASSDPHARSADWIAQVAVKLPSMSVPIAFRHSLRTSPSKMIDGEMTLVYSNKAVENWRVTYMMDLRDNELRAQADVVQEFSRTNTRISFRSLTQSFRDIEVRFTFLTEEAVKEFGVRYALDTAAQVFRIETNLPQYRLRSITRWASVRGSNGNRPVGGIVSSELQYDVDKAVMFNLTANTESSPQLVTRLASRVDGGRETLWSVCLDARLISSRRAQMRMYTERSVSESSETVSDDVLSVTLKQNTDKRLGVYGLWQPKALERVYEFLNEHNLRVQTIFRDKLSRLGNDLREDLRVKEYKLAYDYQSQLNTVNQSIYNDILIPAAAELAKINDFYEELRRTNQFYIRDIENFVRNAAQQVRSEFSWFGDQISARTGAMATELSNAFAELQAGCSSFVAQVEASWQGLFDSVTQVADTLYDKGTTLLQYAETSVWKLIEHGLQTRIENFADFLGEAFDFVGQTVTRFVLRRASEMSGTIERLVSQNNSTTGSSPLQAAADFCVQLMMPFVNSVADALKFDADEMRFVQEHFSDDMVAFALTLNSRIESARANFSSLRTNLVPDDVVRYWNQLLFDSATIERRLSAMFRFAKGWLFDVYGIEIKLRNALRESFDTVVNEMKAEITEQVGLLRTLKSTLLLIDKIRLRRTYDEMDGEFNVELYMPINMTHVSGSLRELNVTAAISTFLKSSVNQVLDRWSIDNYFQTMLETVLLNRIDRVTMYFERLVSRLRSGHSFLYRLLFSGDEQLEPQVRAVGLLSSDHVITFDGRHFELLSRAHCSTRYLLAHHVAGNDSDFSVFVNQRRATAAAGEDELEIESVSLFLRDRKYLVQILNEKLGARVILNTRRLSLPQFIVLDGPQKQATITKSSEKQYHVAVTGLQGDAELRVSIDFAKDSVSVALLGSTRAHRSFYNRLVGIFGFYDSELYNDAAVGQSLIDLFTVETNCGAVTANDRLAPRFDSREMRIQSMRWDKLEDSADPRQRTLCKFYFDSRQSPFHTCFRSVDPRQFYRMCLRPQQDPADEQDSTVEENETNRRRNMCRTAELYSRTCFEHDIRLPVPRVCMHCADGTLKINETASPGQITSVGSRSSAPRVVYIFEDSECVRGSLSSDKLKAFTQQLINTMQSGAEFAVIGMNGRSISSRMPVFSDAHVHAYYQTWMKGDALDSFFEGERLTHWNGDDLQNAPVTDSTDVPILNAIDLALKQLAPFDNAQSKHIVLVSCNAARLCGRSAQVRSRIVAALQSGSVRLHVFTKDNLPPYRALRTGLTDAATLYGYNSTHLALLTGTRARTQEILVEDSCTNAIADTNGVFVNLNLFNATALKRKPFYAAMALQMTLSGRASQSRCEAPVCQCRAKPEASIKSVYFTPFDESTEILCECPR